MTFVQLMETGWNTVGLAPWVVFLPIAGLLANLMFGKYLGERGAGVLASLASGLAFGVSILMALNLASYPEPQVLKLAQWISVGSFNAGWDFRVDTLSVTMMLVVSGVGTLIHIFAIGYMHSDVRLNGDPGRYSRFFVFFNLFIAAMMVLVTANNYLMLFVGWEGVGLCSYLLIGFWFEKGKDGIGNALAAKKAFITNRIGDFGLLLAIFLLFWNFGSLDFDAVFQKAHEVAKVMPGVIQAITLLMLLGVAGKSAQLPLFVWLPDAMAGPTPVSALIHAATMVTAGVYLIARSAGLYVLDVSAQLVVTWVGALTALFAATIALGQNDIKKVLAYSTISQLGYMVAAVGMGAFVAGMFHLVTHAFFKALLFLAAGSVILGMERRALEAGSHHGETHTDGHAIDPQDMRNMGGLRSRMPLTFWVFLAGALALAGVAPLAGFFSKDEILAYALVHQPAVLVVLALTALLTAFYVARQVSLVFLGNPRSLEAHTAVESKPVLTIPLVILALLSIFGGLVNLPGIHFLETWLEHSVQAAEKGEFILGVVLVSLMLALSGLLLGWWVYGRRPVSSAASADPLQAVLGRLFVAVQNKWWVDEFYDWLIIKPFQRLSHFFAKAVDEMVIDGVVNGLGYAAIFAASLIRFLHGGLARSYALMMVVGVTIILAYLILR